MKSEYSANRAFDLACQHDIVMTSILNYVGIVPASYYDELERIETEIRKLDKAD